MSIPGQEEAANTNKPWWHPLRAGVLVLLHLTVHAIVVAYLILAFYGGEQLLDYLGRPHELKFFDLVPVRYIVDAIEIGLFVAFAVRGTWTAFKIFGDEGE